MGKTTQLELKLQAEIIGSGPKQDAPAYGLIGQGFFATKTSDRFKAGRPDLRVGRKDWGQVDLELKYVQSDFSKEEEIGATKLQWLKVQELNRHGMPAAFLVYSESLNLFFVTTLLRDTLPGPSRCVPKLPRPLVIDGPALFVATMEYLHAIDYRFPGTRRWG